MLLFLTGCLKYGPVQTKYDDVDNKLLDANVDIYAQKCAPGLEKSSSAKAMTSIAPTVARTAATASSGAEAKAEDGLRNILKEGTKQN